MGNLQIFLVMLAVVSVAAVTSLAQHKYYARTVRRLVGAHNRPDCVLVSGRGRDRTRLRGAVVVLVLHKADATIRAASVMEGSTVLARFVDRPGWVGRSAREPLPGASSRVTAAVVDALTRLPGPRAPLPRSRFAPPAHGGRPVKPG